jgi:acetyl esterase
MSRGIDIKNISLCGDSAGAHLAASITHQLANENKENVHSQFLIYPMCDPSCDYESHELFKENYLLTNKAMLWFWQKFESNSSDRLQNTYNLLLFKEKSQIPETIIVTAGFDPLSDEAENYAFLLHESGTSVKQLHYPSLFHGFASMTRLKAAKLAVNDFLAEYKEIL